MSEIFLENTDRRAYMGVDRGFIFFENADGLPWKGLVSLDESEDGFSVESFYIDGKKVAQRHYKGNYSAKVVSIDNPFQTEDFYDLTFGFSYRERYMVDDVEFYRLHLVHGVTIKRNAVVRETVNTSLTSSTYSWDLVSVDTQISENLFGSHLILDSADIYDWILRDIEAVIYGWPDKQARIPSLEEIYEIMATMNLVIIDHGDGTWSAVGHPSMIAMLDPETFGIISPTAEYINEETFQIESYIRDETWLR